MKASNRRTRVALILGVLILAAGAAWLVFGALRRPPSGRIEASGSIEGTQVLVASRITGRVVELPVEEGDRVSPGDLIARIEAKELESQHDQAQANLAAARSRLADAQAGARSQEIEAARARLAQAQAALAGAERLLALAKSTYDTSLDLRAELEAAETRRDTAQSALEQAQAALDLARAGATAEQLAQAEAAVAQAKAAHEQRRADLERARQLYTSGAISAQQRDAAQSAADSAQAALDQARERLAELRAGTRQEDLDRLQAAVAQAAANLIGAEKLLETAQQAYRDRPAASQNLEAAQTQRDTSAKEVEAAQAALDLLLAGTRAQVVAQARDQVAAAEAAAEAAATQLGYAVVRAPVGANVEVKAIEVGELVAPGSALVQLVDDRVVWLRVSVPETHYGRINVGDEAEVSVDSFPREVFRGTVTAIASEAEFTPKNVQTKEQRVKLVYEVKIRLPNPDARLKPGMPADAAILLGAGE